MKRLLLIIALVTMPRVLSAQPSCTVSGINPAVASVNAAIQSANDGDVLCLAAGSATWGNIDLSDFTHTGGTKAFELRGAGGFNSTCKEGDGTTNAQYIIGGCGSAGLTQIYVNDPNAAIFWRTNTSTHHMTLDNIQFHIDQNSAFNQYGIINASGGGVPFIIHHNDFIWIGNTEGNCQGYGIQVTSNSGVLYRNRFIGPNPTDCPTGNTDAIVIDSSILDDGSQWASARTFGADDTGGTHNLYVEQNYFENFNVAMDQENAARYVWRFNEMHNVSLTNHGFDSGLGPAQWELYNNTWYCDQQFLVNTYAAYRGATGYIGNNVFPALDATKCGRNPSSSPLRLTQFSVFNCSSGAGGWPGSYPGNWPVTHQVGWGWTPSYITVGTSPSSGSTIYQTNLPGTAAGLAYPTDGLRQSLYPAYAFNNTNNTGNSPIVNVDTNIPGDCRGEGYSTFSKANSTTLVIPDTITGNRQIPYANVGEQALIVFSDVIGSGTVTPTIQVHGSNSCGAMTTLNTGTSGSLRLSAWTCTITIDGPQTITFTHASTSAARAGAVVFIRGLTASPTDANPAVATVAGSPYTSNTTGTLGNSGNEIVMGYFAIPVPSTDTIQPGASDFVTQACNVQCGLNGVGPYIGTNGTSGGNDVMVATSYRVVNSTTGVQPQYLHTVGQVTGTSLSGTAAVTSFFQVTPDSHTGCGTGSILNVSTTASMAYSSVTVLNSSGYCVNDTITVFGTHLGGTSPANDLVVTVTQVSGNPTGLAGAVSFKVNGSTANFATQGTPLDLQPSQFIAYDREIFDDKKATFDGTTGTGAGVRASRPATCTFDSTNGVGVGYWSTDQGSWNTSAYNSGQSGVLDKCTASNTWTAAAYVPATFPHALDNVAGATCTTPDHLAFIGQPNNADLGVSVGTVSVGVYDSTNVLCTSDSATTITIANKAGTCTGMTLAGTASGTDSSGIFSTSNLNETVAVGSCTLHATASGLTAADSSAFTVSDGIPPVPGNSGIITTAAIGTTALTLNWTAATDNITPQNQLQYEVCQSSSNNLTTVANCEANLIQAATTNIVTFHVTGLTASTTYYFNVVVEDAAGNKALYTTVNATTSSLIPTLSGRIRGVR